MIPTRFILPAGALVLGAALGLGAGWKLYRPKPAPVETAAPAIRQADKSLVLQRQPEARPEPKHELPTGAKLERQIQVTVLPSIPMDAQRTLGSGSRELLTTNPVSSSLVASQITVGNNGQSVGNTDNSGQSRAITVDLSLVKMPDGTSRVIASSPDGVVSAGLDIPVQGPMPTAEPLRWSGSVLRGYDAYKHQAVWGAAITYSRGPFVVTGGAIGQTVFVGAGIQF